MAGPRELKRVRSALFTPGTEAARLRKSVGSGSDVCIFDLEDSVPADRVAQARRTVTDAVDELASSARIWVRVHEASDPRMAEDVQALPLDRIEGLVLPKVSSERDVAACSSAVAAAHGRQGLPYMAIIENAAGVLNADRIARSPGVALLALGRFDLAAEIGIDPEHRTPALSAAQALVVLASGAARLPPPLDSPWLRIPDLDGLVQFERKLGEQTQVEALTETFAGIIAEQGGQVTKREYWGLRNLAYRIKKNRKGHYMLLNIDAPAAAVTEMERNMRISEDILRLLTVRVEALEEGPSAMMRKADRDRERDDRGGGFRGDREGGFRGDREGGGFRGDRGPRRPREDAVEATGEE